MNLKTKNAHYGFGQASLLLELTEREHLLLTWLEYK